MRKAFVYWVIDLFEADLGLPGGSPGTITAAGFSDQGSYLQAFIIVLFGYNIHSLYLWARLNHDISVIAAVGLGLLHLRFPVIQVAGSVLLSIFGVLCHGHKN